MARKKTFKDYTNVGNMSTNLVFNNFSFVLFLIFMLIVYIANAHYAENKVKNIQTAQKEIKELRWKYMSMKSTIMQNTQQSGMAKEVAPYGLGLTNKVPKKITID
jgi:hypothetical protein